MHWFGHPNARRRRISQSTESLIADVDGEAELKTTDSAPWSRARARSRAATVSSASSQEMRRQPGSAAPLGLVRASGCSRRSAWCTISGAALPLMQRAWPVGCEGSGCSSRSSPSLTVAVAPQRDTHKGQNVETCVVAMRNPHVGAPQAGCLRWRLRVLNATPVAHPGVATTT